MAIFAETLVEEWLNRRGYFTVRGAKAGQLEMDLLAVRPSAEDGVEALHYEVQASTGPISWLTDWTPELQKRHRIGRNSARGRSAEQLAECVGAWVGKKFCDPRVLAARERLWPGARWAFGLVAGEVRHDGELEEIRSREVEVLRLSVVLDELTGEGGGDERPIKKTSSTAADIAALIEVDRKLRPGGGPGATVS